MVLLAPLFITACSPIARKFTFPLIVSQYFSQRDFLCQRLVLHSDKLEIIKWHNRNFAVRRTADVSCLYFKVLTNIYTYIAKELGCKHIAIEVMMTSRASDRN